MFEFLVGLVAGLFIGVGVCAWAVWAVLSPEK
jgi:hypothetical protein